MGQYPVSQDPYWLRKDGYINEAYAGLKDFSFSYLSFLKNLKTITVYY